MMTCQQIAEFLGDYFENALPFRQRAAFRVHLLLCRDCRRYLASYKKTYQLTRSLNDEDAVATFKSAPQGLVHAILSARASGRSEENHLQ